MRRIARVLGPILVVVGLAACGASNTQANYARTHCRAGGTDCRWDNQCCSGRCYVDTGCSG
ncbi:MAG TPA: hypothetical protein VGL81_19045 [Polyangiaceae bacterium]|jgi:hypothetical protein